VHGLLRRPALPVDGHAGHALGPAGGKHGRTPDVEGLLPGLGHAAPDDVVDDYRVEARPPDDRPQHMGGEIGGGGAPHRAPRAAAWAGRGVAVIVVPLVFIVVLLVGLAYLWRKGLLTWA